jgi:DNA-binding MarR family transcriptional regulator
MDKLTGYEIRFDLEANRILIVKTPNLDDERVIAIEIRAANRAELEQLKSSFEQGKDVNFAAEVQILS